MNQKYLKRALELYRQGKVDQAAAILEIPNTEISDPAILHKSESSRPQKSTPKANQKANQKVNQKPPIILDTPPIILNAYEPQNQLDIDLKQALVVNHPIVPAFIPNNLQFPEALASPDSKKSPVIEATNQAPKKAVVPIEEKVIGKQLPPEIEESMMKWLQIDNDLDKLRQIKRDLDKKKAKIAHNITSFMEEYEVAEIGPNKEIGLEFQVREVKQGFSKKLVTDTLTKLFGNQQRDKILNMMEAQRAVTEKTRLKLNKPKKKKV